MSSPIHYFRAFRFAGQNAVRNLWLTVMTVTILILALFSVSIIVGLNSLTKELLTSVKNRVDISVSLKPGISEDQGRAVVQNLEKMSEVKSVRFISSAEALELFKVEHSNDPNIQETLKLLEGNPLTARIEIQAKTIESFSSILSFLKQSNNAALIDTSNNNLDQAKIVIQKLTNLSSQISKIGFGVTVIFVIISFLVVFNTIRINIYTHREEIGIMKLVGASNLFVRAPFLIEGVMYALFATLLTVAILAPFLSFIGPRLDVSLFKDYGVSVQSFFFTHFWALVVYQFIASAFLNMASAMFAMSRYLKV